MAEKFRRMAGRDPAEAHRASTALELFFDLCFVVAVAQASTRLHHALAEGESGHALVSYLAVFFAIWWAWMNFTWFASAYDTDDVPYRLTTFVQIAGALILAAGVPAAFDEANYAVVTLGYVVMRLAMVSQWLRAAHNDPAHRGPALRYAAGIALVQVGWVARLALPPTGQSIAFVVLVVAELVVPVLAERGNMTTWHPRHIAERYGLFTIIVLGESVLSATVALQATFAAGHGGAALVVLAVGALVIVFSMWWLYFDRPLEPDQLATPLASFSWGYAHYFVFASAAAVGAALAAAADQLSGESHTSGTAVGAALALPVALYVIMVGALRQRPGDALLTRLAYPVAGLLIGAAWFTPAPVVVIAALLVGLVGLTTAARSARAERRA